MNATFGNAAELNIALAAFVVFHCLTRRCSPSPRPAPTAVGPRIRGQQHVQFAKALRVGTSVEARGQLVGLKVDIPDEANLAVVGLLI